MKSFVTFGIPTYNRRNMWEQGDLLESIHRQTNKNFELVIVDDCSTDGTAEFLYEYFKKNPVKFKVRIIRCDVQKTLETQASAIPDNLMFYLAEGKSFLHTDDDTWVSPNLIQYIHDLDLQHKKAIYYGALLFCDPSTKQEVARDYRFKHWEKHGNGDDKVQLKTEWKAEWGALWAAPTDAIRHLGGHELSFAHYRGQDARFGTRIAKIIPSYFVADPAMYCWHRGESWFREMMKTGQVDKIKNLNRSPHVFGCDVPLIANGGTHFWTSDYFSGNFCEVWSKKKRREKFLSSITGGT